ncbi:MAG: GatB/YqeY domain-containing protein [Anaerolineales bacterium]|nr:GatB/YqeY domain-containing protein [Anaerolineales bacterium]MCK5634885.1 GatB/YqeY domain-containing protein [Anaerolineales bacterium]
MMNKETLEAELKEAMRSKDDVRKRTLRMVLSAVKLAEIDRQDSLDEPTILRIIQREMKSRQETIEEAKQAGRDELLASTLEEIEVLQVYLPKPLGEDELTELIQRAIEEVGASTPQDIGKVMKAVMPQIQGRADGKTASDLVRGLLSFPQKD